MTDLHTRHNNDANEWRVVPRDTEARLQKNAKFAKALLSRRLMRNEKGRKHSDGTVENGVVAEMNESSPDRLTNKTQKMVEDVTGTELKASQLQSQMRDNNGILGVSDEEDSAKWAASQIKMIPAKLNRNEKESKAVQGNKSIENGIGLKNDPRLSSQQHIAQIPQSIETSKMVAAPDFKNLKPSNDSKIPGANATKSMINPHDGDINTVLEPYFSQGIKGNAGNSTNFNLAVDQANSSAVQYDASNSNVAGSMEKMTNETTSNLAGLSLQTNHSSMDLLPLKNTTATNQDDEEKAPSLSINITTLRKGQSFDLQMPSLKTVEGTIQDNHLHIAPQMSFSSEYVSDSLQNYSGHLLNDIYNTVTDAEKKNENGLQKVNLDSVSRKVEPLNRKVSPGAGLFDEASREERPAGRTFADKLLEDASIQELLNGKPEQQAQQVQQDETLARALNQSSVSSIIFSANEAISSSDSHAFAKKSTQEAVNTEHKGVKYKRSKVAHSSRDHHRKHKKNHRTATERQVINFGNHLLWVGGQGAADANGFPRHDATSDDPQYNVNSYVSSLLNSGSEKDKDGTTKGYKALQNALTSMESNQGEDYLSFQNSIPGNKEMNDTGQEPASTSVLIQDEAGKPVYQGLVNIVKLNQTKSDDNVTSEVKLPNEADASNKSSEHFQAEQESLTETGSNNQSLVFGTNTTTSLLAEGGKKVNLTKALNGAGHGDENNFTVSKETGADQSPTKEGNKISQDEQLQSEYQDQQHPSSGAQPSAIINKLKSNSNEPETYHIVVNDAKRKVTNANGHVTVIISGPTANEATMPSADALLIPQTDTSGSFSENSAISSNESLSKASGDGQSSFTQADQLSHSLANGTQGVTSQSSSSANKASPNSTNGPVSPLKEDALSALKISEGIEGQLNNDQTQVERENQDSKASSSDAGQTKPVDIPSTDYLKQAGHHFVKIGQDLEGGVDGLQIEEVSRPNIQEEQREEKENPLIAGENYLEGIEKAVAGQSQDVPTLNIILDPSQKFGSSLSVGGKVIPLGTGKSGGDSMQTAGGNKQQLDCHADPKERKTTVTILTCQKKQSFPNIPMSLSGQNVGYFGGGQTSGGPSLQLDQVMNVLNDQVKATINKEMYSESKDIQKMLTGMTSPSSTLLDTDEASSQLGSRQRSPLIGPDEFTSLPEDEERGRWGRRHPHHRRMHHYGFPFTSGVPNYLGLLNNAFPTHRRHFWGVHRHSNPFVVMAHKDHSGEGYWDYQHNIFIPHEEGDDDNDDDDGDDDDDDEDSREKHWIPWSQQAHRKGDWFMPHSRFYQSHFSPTTHHDIFHLRLPTLFGRSGPWRPPTKHKQEQGAKRTAVVHKTVRGDRDTCRPIIEGPSPPLKGEWEYLGKVLCSCPCRLSDAEW